MRTLLRSPAGAAAALGLALLAACVDRGAPTGSRPGEEPGNGPGGPAADPVNIVGVTCTGQVVDPKVTCEPSRPSGPLAALVVGGQGKYLQIYTSGAGYTSVSQVFTYSASVRNLIPQALGTTDGASLNPAGVRMFFQDGPVPTSGGGEITVVGDGVGMFTAAGQPYYQFNEVLSPYELSPSRTVQLNMPPTVTGFTFTAYISAAVQFPNGWIDLTPGTFTLHPTSAFEVQALVRNAVGDVVSTDTVEFATADSTIATVDAVTGLVRGVRAGTVAITAENTAGTRSGQALFTITGTERTWTGVVSNNWHNRNNWADSIVPVPLDSVIIPNPSNNFPVLNQNTAANRIIVQDGATITIGSFDLTAGGDVATGTSGGIVGTTGRVILSGTAKTVVGVFPRIRVTGSYSLDGNITTTAPLRVDLGRLRSTGFRIRSISQ